MTNPLPADMLEERAAEQRSRLHNSLAGLRSSVRDRLDVKRNLSENFWPAASVAAVVMLAFGYALAGLFASD
jgi:hypothetical protein